ncbi:rhomboid-like protein [Actinacidiphila glaucinigra]|uniref:rhomboid-like protein n=1 Tax=Actinacidiphila glaucinigra TaxID=235986 RepID=UPI0036E57DE8
MAVDETAGTAGTGRRRSAPRGAAARVVGPDVRAWVRSTPGTHIWLLVLAATSCVMAAAPPDLRSFLLQQNSTNLAELGSRPVRALLGSALWTESPASFGLYALCFEAVHAPAERWLGTRRWLGVAALAHAGASVLSQQAVLLGIHAGRLPASLARTVDIGVSYGLAGVVGILAHRVRPPWRLPYLLAAAGFLAYPLVTPGRTYTDLGHVIALLIGFACRGLTPRGRAAPGPRRSRPRRWRP